MVRFRLALSLALLLTLIFSTVAFATPPDRITGAITSESKVSLGTGTPTHPWAQYDQGPVEGSFPLHSLAFLISPSPSQQQAIDKLLAQQQDRKSSNYHKWLTPAQYGARFGLSPNDVQKITSWLQSEGFAYIRVAPSSSIIYFSGTAAQVEKTFQTEIHRYQVDGRSRFAPIAPPQIPAALSGIVIGMRGLANYPMKSMLQRRNKSQYYSSSNSTQYLAPGDLYTIYNIPTSTLTGSGQTLAIIGETDLLPADLEDFQTGFGLTSTFQNCTVSQQSPGVITICDISDFQYILYLPEGGTDPLVPDAYSEGDLGEADVDIEYSGATAPSAQVIYVNAPYVDGNGVVDSMSYAIQNNVAPIVSMSYGLCELGAAYNAADGYAGFTDFEFQQAQAQGQNILNSSGDGGNAECDHELGNFTAVYGYSANYPATSPYVTAVGGTLIPWNEYGSPYFSQNNNGNGGSAQQYVPEQAWNDPEEVGVYCAANPSLCSYTWQQAQEDLISIVGGGGGVSNCLTVDDNGVCNGAEPQPSYQAGLDTSKVNPTGAGELDASTPTRYVPDVSLLASVYWPGYIWCTPLNELGDTGDWTSTCANGIPGAISNGSIAGGTSFASPIFAGMLALVNQYLVSDGVKSGLGNVNSMLYTLAATPGAFNPVTTANTGAYTVGMWCQEGTPTSGVESDPWPAGLQCPSTGSGAGFLGGFNTYGYDPTTNYNLSTGLGSVNVSNLAQAWLDADATAITLSNTGAGSQTVLAGQTTPVFNFSVTPVIGTTFPKGVTFSCSFSPTDPTLTNSSCVFTPPSIAAGSPASAGANITLAIATQGPNPNSGVKKQQQRRRRADNRLPWLPFAMPLAGVVMLGFAGRKLSKYSVVASLALTLVMAGLLIACGSSSSSPPPPPQISVTVGAGSPSSLYPNDAADDWPSQTATFSATVANDSKNQGVTWSCSGDTPCGTFNPTATASGTATTYTSPTVAPGLTSPITIIATSVTDTSKTGSTTETLLPATVPGTYTVTVTASQSTNTSSQPVTLDVN